MRLLKAVAFAVCLMVGGEATAQTLTTFVLKIGSVLGTEPVYPAELDGNLATREWLQHRASSAGVWQTRSVVVRPQGICVSAWFSPETIAAQLSPGGADYPLITRAGDRDRLVIQGSAFYAELDIPLGC